MVGRRKHPNDHLRHILGLKAFELAVQLIRTRLVSTGPGEFKFRLHIAWGDLSYPERNFSTPRLFTQTTVCPRSISGIQVC